MNPLLWIQNNSEIILGLISIVVILVKMKYDQQKTTNAIKTQRAEDEQKRKNDMALLEQKRVAHEQSMESKHIEESRAIRKFFQDTLTRQSNQITALELSRDDLQDTVAKLTVSGAEKDGVIAILQGKVSTLQLDIDSLRNELKQYQVKNGELIAENSRLLKDNERLDTLNKSYATQIADLQTNIQDVGTKLDTLTMQLRMAESTIASQADVIKRLTAREDTAPIPVLDEAGNVVASATNEGAESKEDNNEDNDKRKVS